MERTRESSRKCQRLSNRVQNMRSIDRLSGLPDGVICHILSFLPTKISVSTSILAKRWRFLWTHVPNLDIEGGYSNVGTQHSDIVNSVMMLHEVKNLNTFRLCRVICNDYQLRTWITTAIQRSVRNLYLDFDIFSDMFTLPRRLFTCKTLVKMKLNSCKCVPSSGDISLPSLKKLHLSYVEYEDDEALPNLLSDCPVLEELIIDYIFRDGQKNLGCVTISSPTVKSLKVKFEYDTDNFEYCPDYRMIINVPALRYLQVHDCSLRRITSLPRTMTSLIEADIYFEEDFTSDGNNYTGYAVTFLNCLCNLKCLKITSYHSEELSDVAFDGPIVKFDNLTKLELSLTVDWLDLVKFLEFADNLEVLIVTIGMEYYMEPKEVPKCMLSRLRTIRIDLFCCGEHEFYMVRYLLRNAQVLEMMEIFHSCIVFLNPDKQKLKALRRISLFERGSKACQLAFY